MSRSEEIGGYEMLAAGPGDTAIKKSETTAEGHGGARLAMAVICW